MLKKLKRKIRAVHEKRNLDKVQETLAKQGLEIKREEHRMSCWKPWHQHTYEALEVATIPGKPTLFIVIDSNLTGRKLVLSTAQGEDIIHLNPFSIQGWYVRPNGVEAQTTAIAEHVLSDWIGFQNGLIDD